MSPHLPDYGAEIEQPIVGLRNINETDDPKNRILPVLTLLATEFCQARLGEIEAITLHDYWRAMLERLRTIAAEIFGLGAEEIELSMTPEDIEKWDSLNHLRLITAVESEFNIRLSMSQIQGIECLGDIYSYVDGRP